MNLLTNKYVLYFVAFLSIINILSFFFESKFGAIGFFALVAFLMFYFTSNLIIVLGVSLLATNLLGVLAELFTPVHLFNNKNKKENFDNLDNLTQEQKDRNQENNKKIKDLQDKLGGTSSRISDIANTQPKPAGNWKVAQANYSEQMPENITNMDNTTIDMSKKADDFKKNQDVNDFLQSNITSKNLENIQQKTTALLDEQNKMMKQISDLGPILNQSLAAIGNVTTGNIGGTISTLTKNLDSLWEKYPEAFPKDYAERKDNMNQKIKDIGEINSKIKDYTDKNPNAKSAVDNIAKSMGMQN
jgi:DNA repair ATPase RecN